MQNLSRKETSRVSEAIVRAEPRPTFTKSWHPFSHAEVLDAMAKACEKKKLKIVKKEYSIRPNSKMFATWEINQGDKEFHFGIGIRNSIDKTHSIAICSFKKIFVCSNFVFRTLNEWVVFRKHSGQLEMPELSFLAEEALDALQPKFDSLKKWHEDMRKIELTTPQASILTVGAMKRDLIPPSKATDFFDLYESEKYPRSLYGWHGAATELMNDNNLLTINWKQDRLNYFIDYEAPMILKSPKDYKSSTIGAENQLDFGQVRKIAFTQYQADQAKSKKESREKAKVILDKAKEFRKERENEKKRRSGRQGKTTKAERDQSITKKTKEIKVDSQKKTQTADCGLTLRTERMGDRSKAHRARKRESRKIVRELKKKRETKKTDESKKIISKSEPKIVAQLWKCESCGSTNLIASKECLACGEKK